MCMIIHGYTSNFHVATAGLTNFVPEYNEENLGPDSI